jgi:hypothetical protein
MAKKHKGTFQRIDDDQEQGLGPPALLICGFPTEIGETLRAALRKIGTPDHRLVFCTPSMVKRTLAEALAGDDSEETALPDQLPRVMVLSGLSGVQINNLLQGWSETGLPRPIFAGVTPHNLAFPVGKLLKELIQEQRGMNRGR